MKRDLHRVDVFTSSPFGDSRAIAVSDDNIRRARLLAAWLRAALDHARPDILAAEAMSFPQNVKAVALICLAWGVIADELDRRPRLKLMTAQPIAWRKQLVAGGKESDAWKVALRAVPAYYDRAGHVPTSLQEHALDALGVFVWVSGSPLVRAGSRIVAIDPGLATFGLVSGEVNS